MKNTPQFLLALISLLIILVGCGSIDSVPLPDDNPDDATTNAGAIPQMRLVKRLVLRTVIPRSTMPNLENFVVSLTQTDPASIS